MTSRERVEAALAHKEADRLPLDLGSTMVSGMHVSSIYKIRQALGLDEPGTPVKVTEPYQMLGEIAPDLQDALGVDCVGLFGPATLFGWENKNWRTWTMSGGTPTLVPEGFNTDPEPDGDLLVYPEGDKSAPASGRMPKGGHFFDSIVRQPPIDDNNMNVEDNLEEFAPVSDELLAHFKAEAKRLHATGKAVVASFGGAGFGDIALVPAPWLKHPKGIRDITEWYTSTLMRRDYIYEVFEKQCEIALANWTKLNDAIGDLVTVNFVTGTDFGTQHAQFISTEVYQDLYKPFHKTVNDWVRKNTNWKTFIHSCGAVRCLIDEFIDAGFDILNPVQCSATNMDPKELKAQFGDRITFWGGGVDTQHTLPFGTPQEIRDQVKERIDIFAPGGGFIFNPIHNVQARIPTENLMALYEAYKENAAY